MKKKYNIIGANWPNVDNGNKGYSIYKQEGKYIEWETSGENSETFYVDHAIPLAFDDDKSVKKYAFFFNYKPFFLTRLTLLTFLQKKREEFNA